SERLLDALDARVGASAFEHQDCLVQSVDLSLELKTSIGEDDSFLGVILIQLSFDYFAALVDLLVSRKELDDFFKLKLGNLLVFDDVRLLACACESAPVDLLERHLQIGSVGHNLKIQLIRIELDKHIAFVHMRAVGYNRAYSQALHRHGWNANGDRLGGLQLAVCGDFKREIRGLKRNGQRLYINRRVIERSITSEQSAAHNEYYDNRNDGPPNKPGNTPHRSLLNEPSKSQRQHGPRA